jgi:predicted helicase
MGEKNQRIEQYINNINKRFKTGISGEHAYRGDLQSLLGEIAQDVLIINEPSRVACGAPDFIITKRDIPVGYIEAKDIDADLQSSNYKEQFDRYLSSLDNIIFTDYLDFRLYVDGEFVSSVRIADIKNGTVTPLPENFVTFENLIKNFTLYIGQTIKSPKKLAEMMAGKARMLSDVIEKVLSSVVESQENNSLKDQMEAFQKVLINDINPKEFADIYAQTIAYGMFAARLHDTSLETFTRQEAAEEIPKTNPFLRKLFSYIAGTEIDERIKWIVDSLADVFRATDVSELMSNFGKSTQTNDPVIHFYETFLSEYDPKLRKSRGVWYTPEPVVSFIVRAVDDILKSEFGLEQGLADTSKIKIKVDKQGKKEQIEVHKVQILDPAAGTGTFLAEVIRRIYKGFENQRGIWSSYVENHLIPRLNGFELLMASYAMAHLKLDMLLNETGFKPTKEQRFRVYLTNSLEEYHPYTGTLFTSWLSQEANEANYVKRDTPVMVVLGNPPYAISSSNKSEWIQKLISDYKEGLNERKLNLDDDYIKFIRFGQYFIEKNGAGILAYISNNSFIDGITHRQMRKCLMSTFNKVYVLDLHGNSSKKEKAPDGSIDENVFDIQQGVSISIFIKSRTKSKKKTIKHFDCFGRRESKYAFLFENDINSIKWSDVKADSDNCFFTAKNLESGSNYREFFGIAEIFPLYNSGIQTKRDVVNIHFSEIDANNVLLDLANLEPAAIRTKYSLPKDGRDWRLDWAVAEVKKGNIVIHKEQYRPLDYRYSFYTGKSKGIVAYPREVVSKHLINKNNFGLCVMRQFFQDTDFSHVLISNSMIDERTMYSNRGGTYIAPLYTYPENTGQLTFDEQTDRSPNLDEKIISKFEALLGLTFSGEKEIANNKFAPIDILDYIYAVLNSPNYRKKYKEFLKIDFPRVPYPINKETFWQLVKLGSDLRQIHLLNSPVVSNYITSYPKDGPNLIEKVEFGSNKVWINDTQFFDNVSKLAWEFYIGGYQPAQKWLKDRKGKNLDFEDIQHYQKIIVALTETDKLMQEIDKVITKDYLK